MITVYNFGSAFGVAEPSPYVLKILTYCKMAGIEFDTRTSMSNLQKAPKGRLPFIKDGDRVIADSFFILRYLKEIYPSDIDTHLTEEQRACSQLIIRSLDENFYWLIVHSRWLNDNTWPTVKQTFFGAMPWPLKAIIPSIARKDVATRFLKHGLGKHSDEELALIADDTLLSLSTLLSDKTYFWGEKISTLDAVAYAFLAQIYLANLETPLSKQAEQYKNLAQFCERIRSAYF